MNATEEQLNAERKKVQEAWEKWEFSKNLIITNQTVLITIHKVSDLPDADFCCTSWLCCGGGAPDAFCRLSIQDDPRKVPWTAKTIVMKDDDSPCFNQCFTVILPRIRTDVLCINAYDQDLLRADKIGGCKIPIWDIIHLVRPNTPDIIKMGVEEGAIKLMLKINLMKKFALQFNGPKRVTLFCSIRPRFSTYAANIAIKQTLKYNQQYGKQQAKAPKDWSHPDFSGSLASTNSSPAGSAEQINGECNNNSKPQQGRMTTTVANTRGAKIRRPPSVIASGAVPDNIPPDSEPDARIYAEFRKFDLDGNGVITRPELQDVYKRLDELGMITSRARVDQVIDKFGMLDDDQITFEEFHVLIGELMQLKYLIPDVGAVQRIKEKQQQQEQQAEAQQQQEEAPQEEEQQQNGVSNKASATRVQEEDEDSDADRPTTLTAAVDPNNEANDREPEDTEVVELSRQASSRKKKAKQQYADLQAEDVEDVDDAEGAEEEEGEEEEEEANQPTDNPELLNGDDEGKGLGGAAGALGKNPDEKEEENDQQQEGEKEKPERAASAELEKENDGGSEPKEEKASTTENE